MTKAVLTECEGGALLLDLSDGSLAFLNPSATEIWRMHLAGLSVEEIVDSLESSSIPPEGHTFGELVAEALKKPTHVLSSAVGGPYSCSETSDNTLTLSFEGQPRIQVDALSGAVTKFEATPLRRQDLEAIAPKIFAMRGYDVMHGAVVDVMGAAWIITGNSGAGKSTLAKLMAKAGHAAICDDKIVLKFPSESQGTPSIVPSGERAIMDWVARLHGHGTHTLQTAPITVPGMDGAHLTLRGVLVLSADNRAPREYAEIKRLDATAAVERTLPQIYFASMAPAAVENKLQNLLKLIRAAPVFDVHLPNTLEQLEGSVANLASQISKVSS